MPPGPAAPVGKPWASAKLVEGTRATVQTTRGRCGREGPDQSIKGDHCRTIGKHRKATKLDTGRYPHHFSTRYQTWSAGPHTNRRANQLCSAKGYSKCKRCHVALAVTAKCSAVNTKRPWAAVVAGCHEPE